jgi:P pilus assembly chaperone PapD
MGSAPAVAVAQLEVDQLELYLVPRSPTGSMRVFNVSNESEKPVQASLSFADWDRAEDGDNRFYPPGTMRQSCRDMVRVFPAGLRLEPHARQAIRVSLAGADSLHAACWSILFVEVNQPQAATAGGRNITYVVRTGIKVYVEPEGLPRDGVIADIQVRPHTQRPSATAPDTSRQELEVAFRNSGGLSTFTRGTLEVRRLDNSVAAKIPIAEFPVLPGALRRVVLPLPPLPAGRYIALALLDFGGAEVAAGQIDFDSR